MRSPILDTCVGQLGMVRSCSGLSQIWHTFKVASCIFGFLLLRRRFNARIASLGWTVLDRMRSEISKFCAMSSLEIMVSKELPLKRSTEALQARGRSLLDLLIQSRVGRTEPAGHSALKVYRDRMPRK